jgi:hypothetical protein
LEALNDPGRLGNDTLKEQVELALWWVAPEKIGTVVVEDPTPLVAEGITTEALKVIFNGQRKTLIPSGRPVPCQAQYWDSGPRDPISLYRGSEGTTEKDLFLGQFEVMGMSPSPKSVNVSVLCIIANQQILLSARDNNRREFLQIHRVK